MDNYREVNVGDLIPNKKVKIDDDMVKSLADSLESYGLRQPIVCIGRHVLHGNHRLAAAKKLGWKTIGVVEDSKCNTPDEAEAKIIVENLHRRHLSGEERDALRAKLVKLRTAQIAQETHLNNLHTTSVKNRAGRPSKSPAEKKAINEVARIQETSHRAIEESISRDRSKKAGVKTEAEKRIEKALEVGRFGSAIDEYDNTIPAKLLDKWETLRENHKKLHGLLVQAQSICTKIKEVGGECHSYAQKWGADIHQICYESNSNRPYALCPKCGGNGCNICRKIGFVSESSLEKKKYEKLLGF